MRFRVNPGAVLDGAVSDIDRDEALGLAVGWVAIQDHERKGRVVAYTPPELADEIAGLLNGRTYIDGGEEAKPTT